MQRQLGTIQPGVGEHLLDEGVQCPQIALQPLLFRCRWLRVQHSEPVAQPDQRGAQLVGDGIGQLFATGQHGLQLFRHLIEGASHPAQAAAGRQAGAAGEIPVTNPAGGLFEPLQTTPVRAQPEQDRQTEGETYGQQQPHIDPVQLVQIGEIGHWADDQHLIGARDALQEGVIPFDDDYVARLDKGLILLGQRLVGEGTDLQRQGELATLLRHAHGPALWRQSRQFAGEQAEGALHHSLQIAVARPLGADLIDKADQQYGQGETADQQQVELDKQTAHGCALPWSVADGPIIPRRGAPADNPSGAPS